MGGVVQLITFLLALFAIRIFCLQAVRISDVQCPDPAAKCPDKTTCCQLPTKQWGCCPLEHAVCCDDGLHCCPTGTICNIHAMSCDNSSTTIAVPEEGGSRRLTTTHVMQDPIQKVQPIQAKKPSLPHPLQHLLTAVTLQCRDGTFCDDESTCCQNIIGDWGCCPFKNGVCCPDQTHCCPNGTTCDATSGYCWYDDVNDRNNDVKTATAVEPTQMTAGQKWMKTYASITPGAVKCPGDMYKCLAEQTCCQLEGTLYGCCEIDDAVCCADKADCCPSGSTCNPDHTCDVPIYLAWFLRKRATGPNQIRAYAKLSALHVNEIKCPDHKTTCPTGTTCCPMSETAYGCCPLPRAVCCEDKLHCCPTGTTCNVEQQACISARGKSVTWFTKFKGIDQLDFEDLP